MPRRGLSVLVLPLLACSTTDFSRTSNDASVTDPIDGALAPDAGADASLDGSSSTPFCLANAGHLACYDFDDSLNVPGVLISAVDTGATVTVDATDARSRPNAIHFRTPATGANPSRAHVVQPLTVGTNRADLFFDLNVASPATGDDTIAGFLIDGGNNRFWQVEVQYANQRLQILEYGEEGPNVIRVSNKSVGSVAAPNNTWHRLHLRMEIATNADGGRGGRALLEVDGTNVAQLNDLSPPTWTPLSGEVNFGLGFTGRNEAAGEARVDNVIVDVQ